MSRSDLDSIQSQLKVAIQNHQILVAKMKADPQNGGLQKQLHDLQSEITSLSEKQKSIVQLLRKELVHKPGSTPQSSPALSPAPQSPQSPVIKGISLTITHPISTPLTSNHHNIAKQLPTLAPKPQPAQLVKPQPSHQGALPPQTTQQGALPAQATHQGAAGVRQGSAGTKTVHTVNNNTKALDSSHPVETSAQIRVPHFLTSNRPSILQGGVGRAPGRPVGSHLVPVSASTGLDTDLTNLKKTSIISKDASPEERQKFEFMASLDLITPDTLRELQNRRSERKRRSTANPQFSYGHFEPERKRATATYLSQVNQQPGVRRRGRPRKFPITTLPTTPTKVFQLCPVYMVHSKPGAPKILAPIENDVHEDFCAVCYRSGELLMCDTCNLVYHLGCLDPPIAAIPQGLWSCPKCKLLNKQTGTAWPGTLELVASYISHKAAKEEEKQKLIKQLQELKKNKNQLEAKCKSLNEQVTQQVTAKAELQLSTRTAQQSMDKLKHLLQVIQTVS